MEEMNRKEEKLSENKVIKVMLKRITALEIELKQQRQEWRSFITGFENEDETESESDDDIAEKIFSKSRLAKTKAELTDSSDEDEK